MKFLNTIIFFAILAASLCSCIEDGFTTSPSDQPDFSADTLKMGLLFTDEGSPTARFTVYNRASKGISINDIRLEGDNASMFRLNVDGLSGHDFHNVEIRANDSIFVMVDALLPENGSDLPVDVSAKVRFSTNGVDRHVVLTAQGQDVNRLHGSIIDCDTRLTAGKPYQIFDSLIINPGATLTIEAGTRLYFHDAAYMRVGGTLQSLGTAEAHVDMTGDRTGNVVGQISFDIMSRQWGGVIFDKTSKNNIFEHTDLRNTTFGVIIDGDGTTSTDEPALTILNSRLHNSGDVVLFANHASVVAAGTEFAEGSYGLVALNGGNHRFDHCTLANNYLFTAIGGPALQFGHINADNDDESTLPYLKADITNTIIYGLGTELSHGDLTDTEIFLRNCLLRSEGTDDDHFINCIWGEDPLYYTVREDYLFDYRLKPDSPARGAADESLALPQSATDPYGTPRNGALGAYEAAGPEENQQ
ncbi:MAG: hypothetical protein K2L80_02715 [Muribaculaceae bacterium]|nr:hypothetical protein [Muribaculaceae bacterium]MDE6331494.1 hypothetical protein [Muribaculaceae bacterium]